MVSLARKIAGSRGVYLRLPVNHSYDSEAEGRLMPPFSSSGSENCPTGNLRRRREAVPTFDF